MLLSSSLPYLALMHSSPDALILMLLIDPRWSFKDASSIWLVFPMRQILTRPSAPPLMILELSDEHARDVTDFWCASLIVYMSFPLWGPNALILPSLHPLMIVLPSWRVKEKSRLGESKVILSKERNE